MTFAQDVGGIVNVKGVIKDSQGETLPGVSVIIENSTIGTSSDFDGNYSIPLPENPEGSILSFSFMGMETQTIKYSGQVSIDVVMKESANALEEVIVTGYQKIDRRLFTGSAVVLKSEKAIIEGVSDVGRMLQGKAAGVQVQNVSGTFGAAPKIRIRGASSIYGNSKPLWVVDGVVLEDVVDVSADDLASGNAITLIGSAVAGLNANDVESFQVLKDASATALYGARAMNGVIVITTKKGRSGQISVNYSLESSMKMKPSYSNFDVMNSQEQMGVYLDMQSKGHFNHAKMARAANGGVFNRMYDQINTYDVESGKFGLENTIESRNDFLRNAEVRNTDWFDILFKNSLKNNHSVSMSGGAKNSNFYASVSMLNDHGWTVSDKVQRFTASFNSTVQISDKIRLSINTNNSIRKQKVPGALNREMNVVTGEYSRNFDINPFSYALNASRTMAAEENGKKIYYNMNYAPFNILDESNYNFIDLDYLDSKIQSELSIQLLPELSLHALGAVRYVKTTREHKINENSNLANSYRAAEDATIAQNNQFLYTDPDNPSAIPQVVLPAGGFYNRDDNMLLNYYFRATASYNKLFKDIHNFTALVGQETKYSDRESSYNRGYGYQWGKGGVPFVDYRILRQVIDGGFQYYGLSRDYDRFIAFFATTGYSYDERYTINLTGRYDGSNRLGKSLSARWLPTWNVSGSWNIGNEDFMENVDKISMLSVRATYGLTASMGPASNAMAIYMNSVTFRPYQNEKENQISITQLENKDLTWEKQFETNIGFDLGLFNNRISISADFYSRKGFDLIGIVSTSGIGGEGYKYANYADMVSSGAEFSLNTRNIDTKDFSWSTNLTFAYNENKITKLESNPRVIDLIREEGGALEGYPVRGLFSIPFEGLDQNGFPLLKSSVKDENGEYIITDKGVNFQSRDLDFLKYEGPIDPSIVGGMDNTFNYNGFSLSLYLTYQAGNKIRLYPGFKSTYSDVNSMSRDMLNRWVIPGDEKYTNVPAIPSARQQRENSSLGLSYNSYNYSDVRIADGGFVRLKDIAFGYTFGGKHHTQLKLTASNVWLIYSDPALNGQDPEFFRSGGVAMPMARQITFSLKVGL